MYISARGRSDYERGGFVLFGDVFSDREVAAILEAVDIWAAAPTHSGLVNNVRPHR